MFRKSILFVIGAANDRYQHRKATLQDQRRPSLRRDERATRKRRIGVSPYSERDLCVILRYRRRR